MRKIKGREEAYKAKRVGRSTILSAQAIVDYYVDLRRQTTSPMRKKWLETRLRNLEKNYRKLTNSRLKALRKEGLTFVGAQRLEATIGLQGGRYLKKPAKDINQTYAQLMLEVNFLRSKTSLVKSARQVAQEIKSEYEATGIHFTSYDNFIQFMRFKSLKPVTEFFNIFPLSPPSHRSNTATMFVDIWNSGDRYRDMLNDYMADFKRYLDTKDSDWVEGIPATVLRQRIKELYNEIDKRRRYSK